jgi:hypothetical protein
VVGPTVSPQYGNMLLEEELHSMAQHTMTQQGTTQHSAVGGVGEEQLLWQRRLPHSPGWVNSYMQAVLQRTM